MQNPETAGVIGDDELAPTITIGGRTLKVFEPKWKLNKKITPAFFKCSKIDWTSAREEDLDATIKMIVLATNRPDKGQPVSVDQFEDLPVKLMEFPEAMAVIARQLGMTEAKGAAADGSANPPTGTA